MQIEFLQKKCPDLPSSYNQVWKNYFVGAGGNQEIEALRKKLSIEEQKEFGQITHFRERAVSKYHLQKNLGRMECGTSLY
ncbi:MAG: hypothetical protein KGI80_06285 [Verrucomicrobiota bacterium]|nr:hypothetical protein [Verrucomicrobiota bacterium]